MSSLFVLFKQLDREFAVGILFQYVGARSWSESFYGKRVFGKVEAHKTHISVAAVRSALVV